MPARKYTQCQIPGCANPHYATPGGSASGMLGCCRGHYMAVRNRAAAAASKPIAPFSVALAPAAMPPPTIVDVAPMPPQSIMPPPPAWRSEGVALPPPVIPAPPAIKAAQ